MKPLFIQGPSIATRLAIVCVLSLVLMVVDHRQHHVETLRSAISVVIYPIQYLVNLPVAVGEWMGESVSTRETMLEENERLRMQHLLFKAQLQKLSALQVENIRLRELLQSSKKVGENVLIAELMAVDMDPFSRQIVINKGSNDNVYLGQPVLDAEGIMGQIVHLGPFSSTAMLITDPNHAIPVHVNRNGLRAIAVGTGAPDVLEIPYLPNSADIVEGDLLTSSGLGGRFPRDYPVARITQVTKDPTQPYATVTAEPVALLERSREVLLVWPSDKIAQPETTTPMSDTAGASTPAVKTNAEAETEKEMQPAAAGATSATTAATESEPAAAAGSTPTTNEDQ
ncbi:rod shape-determining protein MreC [Kaarinaea lacus]